VDTALAMKIVGHTSGKMWARYNAINERDLTRAAEKLNRYLQEDIQGAVGNHRSKQFDTK
jgi:hypothetical protein